MIYVEGMMINKIRLLLHRLFGIDPGLRDASDRTDRVAATMNGDSKWMLVCQPRDLDADAIDCTDGNGYRREKK